MFRSRQAAEGVMPAGPAVTRRLSHAIVGLARIIMGLLLLSLHFFPCPSRSPIAVHGWPSCHGWNRSAAVAGESLASLRGRGSLHRFRGEKGTGPTPFSPSHSNTRVARCAAGPGSIHFWGGRVDDSLALLLWPNSIILKGTQGLDTDMGVPSYFRTWSKPFAAHRRKIPSRLG